MADTDRCTPEEAERKGDRWHRAGAVCLAAAIALIVFGLGPLALLPMGALVLCTGQSARWYGWRRGYLDRDDDDEPAGDRRG